MSPKLITWLVIIVMVLILAYNYFKGKKKNGK